MRPVSQNSRTVTIPIEMVRMLDWDGPDAYVVVRLMPDRRGVQIETVASVKNEAGEPDTQTPDTHMPDAPPHPPHRGPAAAEHAGSLDADALEREDRNGEGKPGREPDREPDPDGGERGAPDHTRDADERDNSRDGATRDGARGTASWV